MMDIKDLAHRCYIHANKMDDEGWYVTANVLHAASLRLREMSEENDRLRATINDIVHQRGTIAAQSPSELHQSDE